MRSCCYDLYKFLNKLAESLLFLLDLLPNESISRTGEECAFKGDMGRRPAHQSDEMVIFL